LSQPHSATTPSKSNDAGERTEAEGMIDRVQQLHQIWRHLGPEWLVYRLGYEARMRTGAIRRRMPVTRWDDQPLNDLLQDRSLADRAGYLDYRRAQAPHFLFAPSNRIEYQKLFAQWDEVSESPVKRCLDLAAGRLRYFERDVGHTGFPPDWHADPFTGYRAPGDLHWSEIGDFDGGDIKVIWESSRFGFAYPLVRAYWRSGDERFAEMFWSCVEDWRERNPPQLGANWKCGQEISFRVMAWCFGLYGFLDAEATTGERASSLAQMIAVSAARIEANLDYALSQNNNHGISEGVGLWTAGSLFPEFGAAERWKETGRGVLEELGRKLIYDDGAFSQHSVNYHRLMLHDYIWALRLGEVLNQPFSSALSGRVMSAVDWLYQIQDEASGRAPCYGQNDGALILPLSNCDYQDFRPVLQTGRYLFAKTRFFPSGPWNEDLLWLFGPKALESPVIPCDRAELRSDTGGYRTLRSEQGFAFLRFGSFKHRPGQADLLHVDLWWRGQNIALDPGTYSYNSPEPWNNSLGSTAYHNTVTVDGFDQVDKAGRFLWLPWANGVTRFSRRSSTGLLGYWECEHDGYRRLKSPVDHRRGVLRLPDETWLVLDRLTSSGDHAYRLHWLLADVSYQWVENEGRLTLASDAGSYRVQVGASVSPVDYSIVRAADDSPRGWRSAYYHHREPALSVAAVARGPSLWFWSVLGPEACRTGIDESRIEIEAESWTASLQLETRDDRPLIGSAVLSGSVQDNW
jgi:asparagine synthase (glutamine-hydrolysing)